MNTPSLHRTVRIHATPQFDQLEHGCNSHAGQPYSEGICTYFEFDVSCAGPCDPESGFVESIYSIDGAVRSLIVPRICQVMAQGEITPPRSLMPELFALVEEQLTSTLESLTWRLTPFYSITRHRNSMDTVTLCRSYTFSSSHRLHNAEFGDAENERIYGKCSWPSGHGHNYIMEVSLEVPPHGTLEQCFGIDEIDSIVHEQVVDQFDHRYLNLDTESFKNTTPTLENITFECHRLLQDHFNDERGRLRSVRVYETERTWCEFPSQGMLNESRGRS